MNLSHDLQGLKKKAKETFLYALSALLLGIAIGAIDAIFGRVLLFITDFRSAHVVVLLPFLPLAGLGIVWLYRHFNETASKGMTLVMEAGQGKRESIPLALIPLVMAGTWITHLFGGSAGREGVAVQIGATLSHAFARRFHFPDNGRIVLIAGMAAGFGGLFQTPFAAVFFAMEVVVSGSMAYSALLPAAIEPCATSWLDSGVPQRGQGGMLKFNMYIRFFFQLLKKFCITERIYNTCSIGIHRSPES